MHVHNHNELIYTSIILCLLQWRFREEGIRSIHKKTRIPFLLQKEFLFLQHQGMHIVENLAGIDAHRKLSKHTIKPSKHTNKLSMNNANPASRHLFSLRYKCLNLTNNFGCSDSCLHFNNGALS